MSADKTISDDILTLVKQAIIQFTPKLDRYLFQNPEQNNIVVGRALQEGSNSNDTHNPDAIEENPQGYVIPTRKVSNETKSTITIEKSYDQNSFVPGNGLDNSRSTLDYNEKTTFDKEKGVLANSTVNQKFKYTAHPENDLLKTDFSVKSNSAFQLLNHKTYDSDVSDQLFGKRVLSANSRELFTMRTESQLFSDFKGHHDHEKWVNQFAAGIEEHKKRYGVHENPRVLEEETPVGSPCTIRLFPAPKSLFNYDFDLYVVVKLSKYVYDPQTGTSDGVPSVNPTRSYLNAQYTLKFDIYKDQDPLLLLKSVDLFKGNIKVNSTLLDMIPYVESFEKSFFNVLQTLDNKTQAFVKKLNSFMQDLKWDKKLLFQYTYNLAWVASITFEAGVFFDIQLQTALNVQQLYDANKQALKNYYNSLTTGFGAQATAWIPTTIVLSNIPWTNLTNATLDGAQKFNDSWRGYANSVKDLRKTLLNSLTLNLTSTFTCHGNVNFDIRVKVNVVFINVGVKVNGTIVGFQTDALFYIDLLNLAQDIKNPGKYFGLTFSFQVYAFTLRFWIYYEVSDCDWFEKVFNFIMNLRSNSTRLLQEETPTYGTLSSVQNYRVLSFGSWFSSVCNSISSAVTNVIKTVVTDVVAVAKAVVTGVTDAVQAVAKVVVNVFETIKNWTMSIVDRLVSFADQLHLTELKQVYEDFGISAVCGVLPGVKREVDFPITNPLVVVYYQFNLSVSNWEVTYGQSLQAFSANGTLPNV